MQFDTVIFDMDGTVLNTLADLTNAINYAMERCDHRHDFMQEEVKYFVGSGVATAILRALAYESHVALNDLEQIGRFSKDETPFFLNNREEVQRILSIFRPYYAKHCHDETTAYPGIQDLLLVLQKRGIPTAVVSNKPDNEVHVLSETYFSGLFSFCIGEQDGIPKKPAPDMIFRAFDVLSPKGKNNAVYVGDSEVDLECAARARLPMIGVAWGFRGREFLMQHGAKCIAENPDELLSLLIDPSIPNEKNQNS